MKILFIGARLFNEVAYFAKSKGIETILTESNPDTNNLELADEYHIVSRGMEEPMELAISRDVDAVVPLIGIDKPLLEVAQMKEKLESEYKLPVVSSGVEATAIAKDKFKTKKFLQENNIKTPKYNKLNKDQHYQSESPMEYPVVLKQSEGQGGVGVKISRTSVETKGYLDIFPECMIEEYIEGAEISVEVLRWNGKSIPLVGVYKGDTTLNGIHPLNKTRIAPVDLNGLNNQELIKLARKITHKMNTSGTVEVEFIYDHKKKELNTLEINTRPSGTRFLTFCSSNINPMHQLVNMALGEWDPNKLVREIKNYNALELPLPPEVLKSNPKLRNDDNQKRQILTKEKPYIIHGPEKASRITIRSSHLEKSWEIVDNLKLDINKLKHEKS
jgi:carbamoylphosphate synthase large subunit